MPPPPPAADDGKQRKILIGLAACGGLFVLLLIIGALAGDPEEETADSTTTTKEAEDGESSTTTEAETTTTTEAETTTTTAPTTTTTLPKKDSLPTFAPIALSGGGDDVPLVTPPLATPAVARIAYQGTSNFAVQSMDASGGRNDLLVNTIGSYNGVRPINLLADETTGSFDVTASGPWTITLEPLGTLPEIASAPGTRYDGAGDQVLLLFVDDPTRVQITCPGCESNFSVTAWGDGRDLLVNEIGAYDGARLVPGGNVLLEVTASSAFQSTIPPSWIITVL